MTTSSEIPSPHWGAKPMKLAVIGPNANRTLTLTSNYAGCKVRSGRSLSCQRIAVQCHVLRSQRSSD